jgi:D-apiose dehydrogenase
MDEDVATVMVTTGSGTMATCELGYPENHVECDYFPPTLVFVEGPRGTTKVDRDYWMRVTVASGTHSKRYPPVPYRWGKPDYHVVHSSIVRCSANLLSALRSEVSAETTAEDNCKTLELVFAAYDSSRRKKLIEMGSNEAVSRTRREPARVLKESS